MATVDVLATLSCARIVASLGSIVPPQVILTTWSLGAHLIFSDAGNADMEDVTEVRVGDLSTIGGTLAVVVAVWDADLVVRAVGHWSTTRVRVVVGVDRARGEDLLSGLWRLRRVGAVHEDTTWRCALTFLLAWEDALGALLRHGLRGRVSGPPETSTVVVHGAQEVRLDAIEASVEDVTPFARVETVLFTF